MKELVLIEKTEKGRKIVVQVDSHQQKHQATLIPKLDTYTGGSGDKFPKKVDLDYHKDTIAPIVYAWANKMQGYIMKQPDGYLPKDKYALAPNHIDFDVVATYDKTTNTITVTYHCNPNKNAKTGDF